jgi:D-alanyl-D-alanine carboxypeptidase
MLTLKNKNVRLLLAAAIVAALVWAVWPSRSADKPASLLSAAVKNQTPAAQAQAPPAFDKSRFSTDEASSLWAVVNKGRSLPGDYVPADLTVPDVPLRLDPSAPEMHVRADTAAALKSLFAAGKSEGIDLMLSSGYRPYSEQVSLYNNYAAQSGTAQADTFSARPGHSEHQTGLAADVEPASRSCEVDQCFADLPEGRWLAANAYRYGFIIRYGKGAEALTGYEYEPWHIRYVGKELAARLYSSGQTLEQFFGLPAFQTYPAKSYGLKDF